MTSDLDEIEYFRWWFSRSNYFDNDLKQAHRERTMVVIIIINGQSSITPVPQTLCRQCLCGQQAIFRAEAHWHVEGPTPASTLRTDNYEFQLHLIQIVILVKPGKAIYPMGRR